MDEMGAMGSPQTSIPEASGWGSASCEDVTFSTMFSGVFQPIFCVNPEKGSVHAGKQD